MEYCNPKHVAGGAHIAGGGGAHAALPSRRAVSSLSELAQGKFNDEDAEDGVTSLSAALRSSKMVPRVHMRPIHVLAVMLILVTALCASLTMLISQSLTYQKVQNEQASAWPNDVHSKAAGKRGAEASDSNGRFAKHKQKSGHKNNRENAAEATSESDAESDAESGVENTTIQPVNDDGVYDDTVSQQNSNSAPATSTRTTNSSRTQRKSQAAAASSAKATTSQRIRARTSSGSSGNNGNNGNSGRINLNTATVNQIETIKGIGPKTAARIIKQRNAMGRFTRLEDLLRIKGIGPKTLKKLSGIVEIR